MGNARRRLEGKILEKKEERSRGKVSDSVES